MGQQPDPNQGHELRWVLPYPKDLLCECTHILFGGLNLEAPVGAEDNFYTDNPWIFINNDNAEDLRGLLECDGVGKFQFIFLVRISRLCFIMNILNLSPKKTPPRMLTIIIEEFITVAEDYLYLTGQITKLYNIVFKIAHL